MITRTLIEPDLIKRGDRVWFEYSLDGAIVTTEYVADTDGASYSRPR